MVVLESWGTGGTEQYVSSLYRALKTIHSDVSLHLAVLNSSLPVDFLENEPWCDSAHCVDSSTKAGRSLLKLINDIRPDITHLHLYTSTLAAAVAVKKTKLTKLIATFHSPISQWKWRHRIKFWLAVRKCDAVIGASEFTAGQLRRWDPDVITASPPIDVRDDLIQSRTQRLSDASDEGDFLIVGCGRLSREKSWSTLIESLGLLKGKQSVRLELIGDGPLLQSLQDLAREHGVESQVTFFGRMPHDQALERVATADLFVLPSRFEGFGMAAVEAMMLGVPTITADFPASGEFIDDGITGHSFPFDDSVRLAELIRWHTQHPAEALKIGQAGKTLVINHYPPQQIATIHIAIYRRCIG